MIACLTGCAHSRDKDAGGPARALLSTEPPPFIKSPAATLLTNLDGYAAQVLLEDSSHPDKEQGRAGELLVRGDNLFYAPEPKGKAAKRAETGVMIFIWDTSAASGFVLSDALQGYAPISSSIRVTNLVVHPSVAANANSEKVDGHPCVLENVTVGASDGSLTEFKVWRATDLKGVPLRISSSTGPGFTLNLSKIRLSSPAPQMFRPPEGFTKYDTAQAMAYELVSRQQNLRRKTYEPTEEERNYSGARGAPPARY